MKFASLFILILFYLAYVIFMQQNPYYLILIWPMLNMVCMTIAYLTNNPSLILKKNKDGNINKLLLILNLPWLLLTWVIFRIQILLSKEDFCNNIKNTNIWLSRRPMSTDDVTSFDIIIDLTAEFPRDKVEQKYICYPNLDGLSLSHIPDMKQIQSGKNILIHCANGHGRSALFAAIILKESGAVKSYSDGLQMVIDSRPLAIPSRDQRKWLLSIEGK